MHANQEKSHNRQFKEMQVVLLKNQERPTIAKKRFLLCAVMTIAIVTRKRR